MLKKIILGAIRKCGYELFKAPKSTRNEHEPILSLAGYSPWNLDSAFSASYGQCRDNTLVDLYRCYEIWSASAESAKLDKGDMLEVGVWRGGTGALIAAQAARLVPSAQVFLCDTFTGVVKTGSQDTIYKDGMHSDTSVEMVREFLDGVGLKNATLLQGTFPEQTGDKIRERSFRFCHIDVDVYQSSKDVCEWVWPRLESGGIVVFDDYGMRGTEGVTRFVNEWRSRKDLAFIYNLNGHALFIKR
jgi:O-methyltransferase